MSGIILAPAKSAVHCVAGPLSCKARKEKEGESEMGVPLFGGGLTVSHKGPLSRQELQRCD